MGVQSNKRKLVLVFYHSHQKVVSLIYCTDGTHDVSHSAKPKICKQAAQSLFRLLKIQIVAKL